MVKFDPMQGMIAGYAASPKGQEAIRSFLTSPEGQKTLDTYLATAEGQQMMKLIVLRALDGLDIPADVRDHVCRALDEKK